MTPTEDAKTSFDDVSAYPLDLYDGAKVAAHVAGQWQSGQPWQQALPPEPEWVSRI